MISWVIVDSERVLGVIATRSEICGDSATEGAFVQGLNQGNTKREKRRDGKCQIF